jgi:hypothetical protein
MANNSGVQNVNMFKTQSPYEQQIEEMKRRQQMAEMLQQQALQPLESQVAPGGMVVPTSPVLGLTKMLQAYMGGKQLRDIEKQRGEREQLEGNKAMNFLKDIRMGQQQPMSADDALGASLSATPTEAQRMPMSAMDKQGAMDAAMLGGSPQMRMAAQLAAMKPERKVKFGDVDTSKFTPESLEAAERADNLSLLVPVTPKPEKLASVIEEYNFAVDKGYKGSFTDYRKEMARAGATNVTTSYGAPVSGVDDQGNPVFFQPNREGGKAAIIPGVRPEAKPPTDEQAKAAGFAKRLEMANDVLKTTPFTPTIGNQLKAAIPYSNAFLDDAQQKYNQAKLEFITAQLRRESGAVIGPSEFNDANKQYFPQPGDSKELLEQKARSRALAIQNMRDSAGQRSKAAMPSWLPNAQSAVDKYAPKEGQ